MLKFFGLKEILFGLKRFAIIIFAVTLLCGVLGYVFNKINLEAENLEVDAVYSTSRSYILTAEKDNSTVGLTTSNRDCAANAAALIQADFTKEYVYEKLLLEYTKEEVLKYTGAQISPNDMSYVILNDCITVSVLPDSSIVKLNSNVKVDVEFSKKLVGYFSEYFENNLANQIPNLKEYRELGSTTVKVGDESYSVSIPSANKGAVIFAILGFVLSVCATLVIVLFKPAISTKKDFEDYGVCVIDEVATHKKYGLVYTVDFLSREFAKFKMSKVALVSSIGCKSFKSKQIGIADGLRETVAEKFNIKSLVGITKDFASFEEVKKCDGVVLVERKGMTSHTDFADTLALLQKYDIPVLGVILA